MEPYDIRKYILDDFNEYIKLLRTYIYNAKRFEECKMEAVSFEPTLSITKKNIAKSNKHIQKIKTVCETILELIKYIDVEYPIICALENTIQLNSDNIRDYSEYLDMLMHFQLSL